MRVLLSGATGFLGSHLAHAFVSHGHEVAVVVRASSSTRRLSAVLPHLSLIDISALEESATTFRPEAVVHAAACYGRSGEPESDLMEANVGLPLSLLRYALEARSVMFINSDTTLPADLNGYAFTKSRFIQLSRPLLDANIRFANVRLESVYGPGDDDTKFLTKTVKACVRHDVELDLTRGEQSRDFIFVNDAVAAYLILLRSADSQEERWQDYGLGTGVSTTIRELAETVKRESASRTTLRFGAVPYRPRELMRSCADVGRLEGLGWRHRTTLIEGLRHVIAFERAECD
jgi:CDP-paratose synthetase